MRRRLIGALVLVTALVLVVFSVPLASYVARVERDRLTTALERDAFVLAGHAKETLNTTAGAVLPSIQPYLDQYSREGTAMVVVTNASGIAVASNDPGAVIGEDYSNRPEVMSALGGLPAVGERESKTLGQRLLYVAVPVLLGEDVLGVVRLSHPRSHVDSEVRKQMLGVVLAGLFTLFAAGAVAWPIARGIALPIERLTRRTERLADGDFSVRADDSSGPPEVRELSASFNAMAARLGLVIDSQRQFAGLVSHQLRTPLTALRLRIDQLQDSVPESDESSFEAIEIIRGETERMANMVEQLLVLARLEGGTAATVVVDASAVARSRVEMWEPLASERGVSLQVSAPATSTCACIDGGLEQIIDNYVDNALGVVSEGSTIMVSVSRRSGHVVVDVVDEGPGLSADMRERAFDRFWRARSDENAPGSGLGLAIVRQLAAASGGSTELLAREDGRRGLVARVTLSAR